MKALRLQSDDLQYYRRLFEDSRVTAMLSPDGRPLSEEEAAQWLRLSLEHWKCHGFGLWAWRLRESKLFVGRAGLKHSTVNGCDMVEVTYAVVPELWGRGLATEMTTAILQIAFERLDLTEVVCYTLAANQASRRVMEKAGFRFERADIHAGVPHVFCKCTASHWHDNIGRGSSG